MHIAGRVGQLEIAAAIAVGEPLVVEAQQVEHRGVQIVDVHRVFHRLDAVLVGRAVPQVMDYSNESKSTLASYGVGEKGTDNFGKQCLLARRFAEAGVRFIELSLGGWDQHKNLKQQLSANAHSIDKPIAALMADLKQRNLFKDTLIVWGGEFGRTPGAQNDNGRDHNAKGFSMWMAGGGVKGGSRYGATDEYGIEAVKDPMHIHDLHATMLYLLGLDHERLTYRYSGRDFKLTDTAGNVHKGVLA